MSGFYSLYDFRLTRAQGTLVYDGGEKGREPISKNMHEIFDFKSNFFREIILKKMNGTQDETLYRLKYRAKIIISLFREAAIKKCMFLLPPPD